MDRHAIVFGAETLLGDRIVATLIESGCPVSIARDWRASTSSQLDNGAIDRVVEFDDETSLIDALIGKNWVFWLRHPGLEADAEAQMASSVDAFRRLTSAVREARCDRIVATLPASICWEPGKATIDESHRYVPGSASDARLDAYYAVYQAHCYAAADGVDVVTMATSLLIGDGFRPLGVHVPRDGRLVDVCHADEAARAHVEAAEKAPWGSLFLLGGHSVTRSDLAKRVAAPRTKGLLGRGGDDPRRHLVDPGVRIDPARAARMLGFRPSAGL